MRACKYACCVGTYVCGIRLCLYVCPAASAEAPAEDSAEAAQLLKELQELQMVRDRVTALREWLSTGGQLDPSNPTSVVLDQLMASVMQECADDPSKFSEVLTERYCIIVDCLM